jgi:hypothetical protein
MKAYGRAEAKVHAHLTVALMKVSGHLHAPMKELHTPVG